MPRVTIEIDSDDSYHEDDTSIDEATIVLDERGRRQWIPPPIGGRERVPCPFCDASFLCTTNTTAIKRHVRTFHEDDVFVTPRKAMPGTRELWIDLCSL